MTEIALLSGGSPATVHPWTTEDILADRGGVLRRRGKVLYDTDFSDGYDGWGPIFNKWGTEVTRPPVSRVANPVPGMRVVASGSGAGQSNGADAILRLARPTRSDGSAPMGPVSISMFYSIVTEFASDATETDYKKRQIGWYGIGLDTQSWWNPSLGGERQYFYASLGAFGGDINNDRISLRADKVSGSVRSTVVSETIAQGMGIGYNENKNNLSYMRLTVQPGPTPDYIELQAGGRTVDLRGRVAADGKTISEPLQLSATDFAANFNGGFNPFIGLSLRSYIPATVTAAGIVVTRIVITHEDVIA